MATNLSKEQIQRLKDKMLFRESTGDYTKVSKKHGYVGGYQFGAQALETIGYLKPGAYAKAKAKYKNGNKAVEDPKNWTGKDKIRSLNDFVKNPKVQDKAFEENLNQNFKSLKQKGLIKADTPASQVAGYLAASHLIGTGTLAEKGLSAKDANQITGHEYFKLGQQAVAPSKTKSTLAKAVESVIPSANAAEAPVGAGAGRGFVNPPLALTNSEFGLEVPGDAQSQFRQSELAFDRNKSLLDLQYPATITEPIQVIPNVRQEYIPEVSIGAGAGRGFENPPSVMPDEVYRDNEIRQKTFMGEPVAPQNIWRDSSGNPILDRWGGYIYQKQY